MRRLHLALVVGAALMTPPAHAQDAGPVEELSDSELRTARSVVAEALASGAREQMEAAISYERRALREFRRRGSERAVSVSHLHLAMLYTRLDQHDSAAIHLNRGDSIAHILAEPSRIAWFTVERGHLARSMGNPAQALRLFCSALPQIRKGPEDTRLNRLEAAIEEIGRCEG